MTRDRLSGNPKSDDRSSVFQNPNRTGSIRPDASAADIDIREIVPALDFPAVVALYQPTFVVEAGDQFEDLAIPGIGEQSADAHMGCVRSFFEEQDVRHEVAAQVARGGESLQPVRPEGPKDFAGKGDRLLARLSADEPGTLREQAEPGCSFGIVVRESVGMDETGDCRTVRRIEVGAARMPCGV